MSSGPFGEPTNLNATRKRREPIVDRGGIRWRAPALSEQTMERALSLSHLRVARTQRVAEWESGRVGEWERKQTVTFGQKQKTPKVTKSLQNKTKSYEDWGVLGTKKTNSLPLRLSI